MKSVGIWLALIAAALMMLLPVSAASSGLALADAGAPCCATDRRDEPLRDRPMSQAPVDTEEESEEDSSADDDAADAGVRVAPTLLASAASSRCTDAPTIRDDGHRRAAHAPRGPPERR